MKLFILGILTTLIALAGACLVGIYGGLYNVSADTPHTNIVTWILGTAMTKSVKAHATAIVPPSDLGSERRVHDGFHLFDEMCVECHGAPGTKPGEVGMGLSPEPPDLTKVVRRWNTPELFWIVNHGIKATGMPAFGRTHTDEQLWSLVAFVERLPDLTAEQYKALEHAGGKSHDHEHHRGH
jgi:mono/diheme cytochrome c family protein